uniref:Uncharacterized protein n=2 Tax=Clytia hemisphaerica TaxID=252671 RepID=A0A7M5VFN6_9CNID
MENINMPRKRKIRFSFVGGRRPRFSDFGTADTKADLPVNDQKDENVEEQVIELITKDDSVPTSNKTEKEVSEVGTNDENLEKLSRDEIFELHCQIDTTNKFQVNLHQSLMIKKKRLANYIGCQTNNVDSTLDGNLTQTICETPRQLIKKITNLK